jgi:hypothetical protein
MSDHSYQEGRFRYLVEKRLREFAEFLWKFSKEEELVPNAG